MDLNGNTPLHMACSNGHIEAATLLLNAKANFLIKNQRGETPLHNGFIFFLSFFFFFLPN